MRPAHPIPAGRRVARTRWSGILLGIVSAALVAACGSSVKLDETPVVDANAKRVGGIPQGSNVGTPQGTGTQESKVAMVSLDKAPLPLANLGRTVYFDFDSFVVKEDFRTLIESHARVLASNKGRHMRVEGHTDERGGREYNLALGQKRAEAVAKSLALLGAGDAQIEAVSFGKEQPASEAHDEVAWAKNRRAELKDR